MDESIPYEFGLSLVTIKVSFCDNEPLTTLPHFPPLTQRESILGPLHRALLVLHFTPQKHILACSDGHALGAHAEPLLAPRA